MMLLFIWNGAATTVLPGPFAAGGRHKSRSSTPVQLLGPLPKRAAAPGTFQMQTVAAICARGRRQPHLKNVVQIARKPCPRDGDWCSFSITGILQSLAI